MTCSNLPWYGTNDGHHEEFPNMVLEIPSNLSLVKLSSNISVAITEILGTACRRRPHTHDKPVVTPQLPMPFAILLPHP